jgi:hypothetical protein
MKTNLKITLASLALIATFGTSTGIALAAHEEMPATQEQKMHAFLGDLSAFLKNVQKYVDNNESGLTMEPTTTTPAADLRVTLNALLREHVNLGMLALYNVIDNDDATAASVEALDGNTNELAATIGSVYGEDAQSAFDEIWTAHIGFFANYATGLRTNDADLREAAEEDLKDYQSEIANFFNGALPAIDRSVVVAGSGEHKDLLIEAMDEYADGDYKAAYAAQREADKQIAGIANLLAREIVKQNPSLF